MKTGHGLRHGHGKGNVRGIVIGIGIGTGMGMVMGQELHIGDTCDTAATCNKLKKAGKDGVVMVMVVQNPSVAIPMIIKLSPWLWLFKTAAKREDNYEMRVELF